MNVTVAAPALEKMDAVVLAADRRAGDPLADAARVASKSLVPAGGIAMLERVVRALEASRWIGRILIVHNIADLPAALPGLGPWMRSGKIALAAAEATPSLSALHAIETLGRSFPILITTSDHALLTTEMVDFFCDRSTGSGADICAGVTAAETVRRDYPLVRRTYIRFRDGAYSGSNLYAVMSGAGLAAVQFWRHAEGQRKKPWRVAGAFGLPLLLGYALRLWPLHAAMAKAGRRIGVAAAPVVMPFAAAAIDVDTPDDLKLVNDVLATAGQR